MTHTTADLCRAPRWLCRTPQPALHAGRGLCGPCEADALRAVGQLGADYQALALVLTDPLEGSGGMRVNTSSEHRTPLNASADALQGRMIHAACWWEDEVLTALDRRVSSRAGLLPAWRLTRAVTTLLDHSTALLMLDARPYRHDDTKPMRDMDGVDALLDLAALHRSTNRVLGVQKLVHQLPGYCQNAACARSGTLRREDGADTITCALCDHTMTMAQYDRYLSLLAPRPGEVA